MMEGDGDNPKVGARNSAGLRRGSYTWKRNDPLLPARSGRLGSSMTWQNKKQLSSGGNTLVFIAEDTRDENDMAVVIPKPKVKSLISWKSLSNSIETVPFHKKIEKVTLGACYELANKATNISINMFSFVSPGISMRRLANKDYCVKVLDIYGHQECNTNERLIIELVQEIVANDNLFDHKDIYNYFSTILSGHGKTRRTIF
ncbi:hypothetical protein QYM36_006583 [Artemia franciscana]|uniref:Uncharacterized protein n=1 Tax=Artemia franciscana TaxID=6661 RepID=A0AA88IAL9_ARTSF|nr:hypothetical protein QYM36_006583 [Artemia franciscana]